MSERKKLLIGSDLVLFVVALFIGIVCFYPANVNTSAADGAYRHGNRDGDGVSLMINVYWGTEEVYRMLDVFDEYAAKATFFIGGSWADDNVECLKEIVKRGHEVGSHGYFHKDCEGLSYEKTTEEIELSSNLILLATGKKVDLFAPPSGSYDKTTLRACNDKNMKLILWSRDTVDWRDKDSSVTFDRATNGVKGGELILMHPMTATAEALPKILDYYKQNGLRTVTVTENITYGGTV